MDSGVRVKLVEVEVTNLGSAIEFMSQADARIADAFAGGVYLYACQVITLAMRLAPAVTGFLRASGYVTKPALGGGSSFMIEGGFGASYAYWVETLDRNHHEIGQSRFLATALAQTNGGQLIAKYTAQLYKRGGSPSSPIPQDKFAGGGRLGHAGAERKASIRRVKIYRKRLRQTQRRAAEARALRWE